MEALDLFIRMYGYPALFGGMVLEQFVPPMPGEPLLLGAGALAGNGRLSPENSRAMKEKSHRAPRRCYRSGVWTLHGTQTWRLDGHSLYSAQRPAGPRDFEADHRPVRPAAGQFRRRRPAAEDGRRSARSDLAIGQRH